jgi:hypothetical protein
MPNCTCIPVAWRGRSAWRLSNGRVELTVLTGGGNLADFRLCGSSINLLWTAPWPTLDAYTFTEAEHGRYYGTGPSARLLSGCTGHFVVAGYFGMPSDGGSDLPLHGEAASALWTVTQSSAGNDRSQLAMEVSLPGAGLHLNRQVILAAEAAALSVTEQLTNKTSSPVDFQWVQHVMFGAPLFSGPHAKLSLPAQAAITWPYGYEGREVLEDNSGFVWPMASTIDRKQLDLSRPFQREGTGFVASVLTADEPDAYVAITNTDLGMVAGYVYDRAVYPWIALWEENRARMNAPWHGKTQVRGVEFGNSPMPLGLEYARSHPELLDAPTYRILAPGVRTVASYSLFAAPTDRADITGITRQRASVNVRYASGQVLPIENSLFCDKTAL